MKNVEKMEALVATLREESAKFEGGNMSACARVRKVCQEIKVLCKEIRTEVQEAKVDAKKKK